MDAPAVERPCKGGQNRRHIARRLVLLSLVFVMSVVVGDIWKRDWRVQQPQSSPLHIDPVALDFGIVWAQSAFELDLPIHNTSQEDVAISNLRASPCCVSKCTPSNPTISAGATEALRLCLNLMPTDQDAEVPCREFAIEIAAQLDSGHQDVWQVRGRVRNAMAISPPVVDFDRSVIRGAAGQARTAYIKQIIPLTDLTIDFDATLVSAQLEHCKDRPNDMVIHVSPSPTLPQGPFTSSVTLRAKLPGGECPPGLRIPIRGFVEPTVMASPSRVAFGVRRVRESACQRVTLTTLTTESFEVVGINASSHTIDIVPGSIPGDTSQQIGFHKVHVFGVSRSFDSPGSHEDSVEFITKTAAGIESHLVVPVHAHVLDLPRHD